MIKFDKRHFHENNNNKANEIVAMKRTCDRSRMSSLRSKIYKYIDSHKYKLNNFCFVKTTDKFVQFYRRESCSRNRNVTIRHQDLYKFVLRQMRESRERFEIANGKLRLMIIMSARALSEQIKFLLQLV